MIEEGILLSAPTMLCTKLLLSLPTVAYLTLPTDLVDHAVHNKFRA